MYRRVAVGALRISSEAGVETRHRHMAAVAEIGDALKGQHVAVGRAVGLVTGHTAFDALGSVLEDEGAALVSVACGALLLLEAAEPPAPLGRMRIMAGGAIEGAFLQAVAFIEFETREDIGMALATGR